MGIALCLLLAGTSLPAGQEVVEAIVAVVNDEIITLSDYKQQYDLLYQTLRTQLQGEDFEKQWEQAQKGLLDSMITNLLLLQKGREQGIDVTEQLNMYISNILQQNSMQTEAQLRAAIQQEGVDFDDWKEEQKKNILLQAVVYSEVGRSIVIDDVEILTYYRQHPEEFTRPPEFTLRGIFLANEGKTDGEMTQSKQMILDRLSSGEDFEALAEAHSEGPNKDKQGDMGSYEKGQMLAAFEQEVEKLEAGGVTPWIPIETGWYLLKVEDKRDSYLLPFEEVRDQVQEKIYFERNAAESQKYVEKLRGESYIKILIPNPFERLGR